jgi:hypothetical protein
LDTRWLIGFFHQHQSIDRQPVHPHFVFIAFKAFKTELKVFRHLGHPFFFLSISLEDPGAVNGIGTDTGLAQPGGYGHKPFTDGDEGL